MAIHHAHSRSSPPKPKPDTTNAAIGFGITCANHIVQPGVNTPWRHSFLVITPTNQALYQNDPRFKHDANGNVFLTIGAGPAEKGDGTSRGNMWAKRNRDRDVAQPWGNQQTLAIPSQYANEDEAIEALLTLMENYDHHVVKYHYGPWGFKTGGTNYNSNSFISGLLNAAGFSQPQPPYGNVPGFNNPLPVANFASP